MEKMLGNNPVEHGADVLEKRISVLEESLQDCLSHNLSYDRERNVSSQESYEDTRLDLQFFIPRVNVEKGEIDLAKDTYGSDFVEKVIEKIKQVLPTLNLSQESTEGEIHEAVSKFVNMMMPEISTIYNPKNDALYSERYRNAMNEHGLLLGIFEYDISSFDDSFVFGNVEIQAQTPVLELHIGELMRPTKDQIKPSMHAIADFLSKNPELQAVVGHSWLFSHPLAQRLGFEVFDENFRPRNEHDPGPMARAGKPGFEKLGRYPFRWGGMNRDDFLKLYAAKP